MSQADSAGLSPSGDTGKFRVLVVDDDADAATGVQELLEMEGHTVAVAHDGTNALRAAVMMTPDMALVDLRLKGEWGLDVVQALRSKFPDIVAVIMTGESDSSMVIRALREGIYDYLTKPFEPEHLLGVVDRGAEKVRLQRERRHMLDELSAARDKAELASRSKTEFLTRLSGELGEQFTGIVKLASMISDQQFGAIEHPNYVKAAGGVAEGCRRLSRIMMWIGELGQLEAGTMPIERGEFQLRDVVEKVFRVFEHTLANKHITTDIKISPDMPALNSDSTHFARILGHLVSNAAKFTGNGGTIAVSAIVDGFGELRIDVADNGIGMSSDDIDLAMAPFGRLHSSEGHDPFGVGLGLPLAGKFTRLLGGRMTLDSRLGQGTHVQMQFPRGTVLQDAPMQKAG